MRHGRKILKLGRTSSHRKALLSNLANALIRNGTIRTTDAKAKALRRYVDRLVTFAKKGDLAARRHALRFVPDPGVVRRLFEEIAPRLADREGGYTRLIRLGTRRGDGAEVSLVTFSGEGVEKGPAEGKAQAGSKPQSTEEETAKAEP